MTLRVCLAGPLSVEAEGRSIAEAELGGRQSRLAFAYLVYADGRPVPRDELAEILWPDGLPASWEISLAAIVSKLRAVLARAGVPRDAIGGALGCYQLRLAPEAWVDVLAAGTNLYRAEGALRRGDLAAAGPHAMIASSIARRPFLPEDDGVWVERMREELRRQRVRALEIFAEVLLGDRDNARAAAVAAEVLELEPYRETAHQLLMRAHDAAGNRADALRVYDRCRRLLREELGVDPSPATEAVYLAILRR